MRKARWVSACRKTRANEFLKKHKAELLLAYGIVMKEYVAVPDALLKNPKTLAKYFAISYELR